MSDEEPERVVKVALHVDGRVAQEVLHDMRADTSLADHVAHLHQAFGLRRLEPTDVALFVPTHGKFVSDADWSSGRAVETSVVLEGCTLHLKVSPQRRALDVVERLMHRADLSIAVEAARTLPMLFFDSQFGEAFLANSGVEVLLHLATAAPPGGEDDEPSAAPPPLHANLQLGVLEALRTVLPRGPVG